MTKNETWLLVGAAAAAAIAYYEFFVVLPSATKTIDASLLGQWVTPTPTAGVFSLSASTNNPVASMPFAAWIVQQQNPVYLRGSTLWTAPAHPARDSARLVQPLPNVQLPTA